MFQNISPAKVDKRDKLTKIRTYRSASAGLIAMKDDH